MKKKLQTILVITIIMFTLFAWAAVTSGKAHAESDDAPRVCPVPTPVTVYVDRPIDRLVTQTVTKTVVDQKIVKVEVPVYEANPVTTDPKTIRAMMKVTHDRYLSLLAKYREVMKAKKK